MIIIKEVHSPEERQAAFLIRKQVFQEEQGVPPEIEQDVYDENRTTHHYLATMNHQPVGTARWRETTDGYKLERFAILPAFRKQQIGGMLLNQMIQSIPKDKGKIYLHAQKDAMNFYLKHGFQKEGTGFTEAGIEHYTMTVKR